MQQVIRHLYCATGLGRHRNRIFVNNVVEDINILVFGIVLYKDTSFYYIQNIEHEKLAVILGLPLKLQNYLSMSTDLEK